MPGRRKSPQRKKQESYDNDYRPLMENPHAFRQKWAKKKARANRRMRAEVRGMSSHDALELTAAQIKTAKCVVPKIVKSYVMTLRERIENNKQNRARRAGRKAQRR